MLAMAMPIAVVGLIQAKRWRHPHPLRRRGLAIIMLAVLATQRKTGIIAPVAGVATLAYFRRRELLKLAPLGVALLAVLVIVSPGTVQPVIDQFQPDRLGADTVSDRASDYDAVRPDVWTHLAFGRGYGSYQPLGHRILSSSPPCRISRTGSRASTSRSAGAEPARRRPLGGRVLARPARPLLHAFELRGDAALVRLRRRQRRRPRPRLRATSTPWSASGAPRPARWAAGS